MVELPFMRGIYTLMVSIKAHLSKKELTTAFKYKVGKSRVEYR